MDGLQPITTDKMREIRESEGGLGVVTTDQLRGLREDATSSPKLIDMATEEAITLLIRVAIVDERRAKLLAIQSAMQSEEQWCSNAMGVIMASLETSVVEAGDDDTITRLRSSTQADVLTLAERVAREKGAKMIMLGFANPAFGSRNELLGVARDPSLLIQTLTSNVQPPVALHGMEMSSTLTNPQISTQLDEYFNNEQVSRNYRVLIVAWSGHGEGPGRGNEGAWCLNDRDTFCPQEMLTIWDGSLAQRRGAILFLFMDSCHSGVWVNTVAALRRADVVVQSACGADECSLSGQDGGCFTKAWCRHQSNALVPTNLHRCYTLRVLQQGARGFTPELYCASMSSFKQAPGILRVSDLISGAAGPSPWSLLSPGYNTSSDTGSGEGRPVAKALHFIYEKAIRGMPGQKSAAAIADGYKACAGTIQDSANALIRAHNAMAAGQGFLSQVAGPIVAFVSLPANMAALSYVWIRMSAALAYLGGRDLESEETRKLVFCTLVGHDGDISNGMLDEATLEGFWKVFAALYLRIFARDAMSSIPLKVLPVLSGVVGAVTDGVWTNRIGNRARDIFLPPDWVLEEQERTGQGSGIFFPLGGGLVAQQMNVQNDARSQYHDLFILPRLAAATVTSDRSTAIFVHNQTPHQIHLVAFNSGPGSWASEPPTSIMPNESRVMFGCTYPANLTKAAKGDAEFVIATDNGPVRVLLAWTNARDGANRCSTEGSDDAVVEVNAAASEGRHNRVTFSIQAVIKLRQDTPAHYMVLDGQAFTTAVLGQRVSHSARTTHSYGGNALLMGFNCPERGPIGSMSAPATLTDLGIVPPGSHGSDSNGRMEALHSEALRALPERIGMCQLKYSDGSSGYVDATEVTFLPMSPGQAISHEGWLERQNESGSQRLWFVLSGQKLSWTNQTPHADSVGRAKISGALSICRCISISSDATDPTCTTLRIFHQRKDGSHRMQCLKSVDAADYAVWTTRLHAAFGGRALGSPSVYVEPGGATQVEDSATDITISISDGVTHAATQARVNPRWMPDEQAERCMLCMPAWSFRKFGLAGSTRHHCRYCGWVVCQACMPKGQVLQIDRWVSKSEGHPIKGGQDHPAA
jgi:hypothetical protein